MAVIAKTGFRLVLTSCADQEEAERIAHSLIESQLAACVNILPGARSIYRWQGKTESTSEVIMLIKTDDHRVEPVEQAIAHLHSYAVPEFLVLEVSAGSSAYLEWLAGVLQSA